MTLRRLLPTAVALVATLAPVASAQAPAGPDYVASDNVQLLTRLKQVGDGVGATIVGDFMYVTSTTHLTVFNIKGNPANPEMLGSLPLNIEFENEEVPTNGKVLGISADTFCVVPDPVGIQNSGGSCLSLYDVSDPNAIKLVTNIPDAGDHTSACLLDCTYFYGSAGTIVDARDVKSAKKLAFKWTEKLAENAGGEFTFTSGCHHVREITPGILLGSCQPIILMSVRPEDGGSPESPVLLASGSNEDGRFIHSSRWPRKGKDKFVLVGGEQNAQPQCSDQVSAFMTWDGSKAIDGLGGFPKGGAFSLIDEVRPINGQYIDGHSPYNALGCSVHWFEEAPSFHNGGLVALAEYENGTRFLQITPEGKIVEQGYFLPLAGSTSAPHWNPFDPSIVYNVDYARGVDVLKWTGDYYVPTNSGDVVPDPSKTPGTGGAKPGSDTAPCASAAGFESVAAKPSGGKVKFTAKRREQSPFTVEIFQQSAGSKVVKERLIVRFKNKSKDFAWNGKDRKGRKLANGNYFVRYTMKLKSGLRDIRRVTLSRKGAKFSKAPDFYQRVDCGFFKSLKLSSSVFGGKSKDRLGIAYKLAGSANAINIVVKVGSKTVKKITGKGTAEKTFRYSLPASIAKKGKLVKVLVTPDRGGAPAPTVTLTAKRI